MQVSDAELEKNLDKYLELVQTENIWITKNGRSVAKLVCPNASTSVDAISGVLAGKVPADLDRHALREARLSKYAEED